MPLKEKIKPGLEYAVNVRIRKESPPKEKAEFLIRQAYEYGPDAFMTALTNVLVEAGFVEEQEEPLPPTVNGP